MIHWLLSNSSSRKPIHVIAISSTCAFSIPNHLFSNYVLFSIWAVNCLHLWSIMLLFFFTVFTFLLLFISNLFTNLLVKCTQSLLNNLHVFNSIHFFAFLTWMTMYWRLILHASLFAYNWMDLTKLYRTCHYMKAYKGLHCLCCYLYIEGMVNGRRIDNDRNFYFSQSPGHLLTVYQAISWLSVRPSTDCLLDPSVQDQTMMENQSLNFKSPRFLL